MEYIRITKENIDEEHICCAMSNNQSQKKKEWLKERFDEGLVFYRANARGKCFIEYIDSENAWVPIEADNYLFINCLWVSGSFKGNNYSVDLLNYCIEDAKRRNKDGICIISSKNKKKEFLSDPKFLAHVNFKVADTIFNDYTLMYLPLTDKDYVPRFKDVCRLGQIEDKGLVIYYSNQCPFTYYWVPREAEALLEAGIEVTIKHIDTKEKAQNAPTPITNYSIFKDGKFVSNAIKTEKKIVELASK